MTYYRDSSQETPKRQLCPAKRSFPLHPPAHDKVSERSDEKRPPCLLTLSSQEAKAGRQTVDTSSDETITVPLSAMVFQVCHRTCSAKAKAATKTGPPMFLRFARPVSLFLGPSVNQSINRPQVPLVLPVLQIAVVLVGLASADLCFTIRCEAKKKIKEL